MNKTTGMRNNFLTRRGALKGIGGLAASTAVFNSSQGISAVDPVDSADLPNIVWIISDDHSRDDLGCYGNPVKTPNLDKLAREGARFMNACAASPSCSPSRTSMFTGKYAHTAGAEDLHSPLPAGQVILPGFLRQKGYFSGNLQKLHLGPEGGKQFDRLYKNVKDWPKFVEERPEDQPFFLVFGFTEPHRPYQKNTIPNPHDPAKVIVPPYLPDTPEVREDIALYYDEIALVDSEVGKFLQWLDKNQLRENTLILFFGDQGMPFPRAKTTLYDSGIRVPFIANWPGQIPAGIVQDGLFSLVDLTPTMLNLAGITPSPELQGQNMWNMFIDPLEGGREVIYAERNWHDIDDHVRCLRTERFKYIRNFFPEEPYGIAHDIGNSPTYRAMVKLLDTGDLTREQALLFRSVRPEEELYDLRDDPNEFENLIYKPEYREHLIRFRKLLDKWIAESRDVSPDKRFYNIHNVRTGEKIRDMRPERRK